MLLCKIQMFLVATSGVNNFHSCFHFQTDDLVRLVQKTLAKGSSPSSLNNRQQSRTPESNHNLKCLIDNLHNNNNDGGADKAAPAKRNVLKRMRMLGQNEDILAKPTFGCSIGSRCDEEEEEEESIHSAPWFRPDLTR